MKLKFSTFCLSAVLGMTFLSCENNDPLPVIPPSDGAKMTLNGGEGGATAINAVFVDLSANKQDSVKRASWNLGFYCGDEYRVILNNTIGCAAKAINKTDLKQVTATDTVGFGATVKVAMVMGLSLDVVDNIFGDLSKTVFGDVSATDANNKVYIVNPGNGGGVTQGEWKKVRVTRNSGGYTVQYAAIGETDASKFKTINVPKNADYLFNYISFESGSVVPVEKMGKGDWDIQWTGSTYTSDPIHLTAGPYFYSDFVYVNEKGGVKVAEILVANITYSNYSSTNITSTTFLTGTNAYCAIGSSWRGTPMGGTKGGVKTDRYYVIQDAAGNVYKLRFLNFISDDGGKRGYPEIEFALVK